MARPQLIEAAAATRPPAGTKSRAAAVSILSNATLVLLKAVAGTVTGSVAILTEALHSALDLIASVVAFFSVRKADEPADDSHPYGHEKVEDLAAAIEGVLILVGSAVVLIESVRRLVIGSTVDHLGFGIAIVGISVVVNLVVSGWLGRQARRTRSPALAADAAHLRADVLTSGGVLAGLVLVEVTGASWVDPAVALLVGAAIVVAGLRILRRSSRALVDESLPARELDAIREEVHGFGSRGVVGFHALRARRGGARRYVDLHVQFRAGTSLETAHRTAHELQDAICVRLLDADVLIHIEPEDRVRPGEELPGLSAG